jgi:hypothetical protein
MYFHWNLQVYIRCQGVHRIRDRIDVDIPDDGEPISEADEAVIISDNSDDPVLSKSIACRFDGILNTSCRVIASKHQIESPIVLSSIGGLSFIFISMEKRDALVVKCSKRAPLNSLLESSVGWHIGDKTNVRKLKILNNPIQHRMLKDGGKRVIQNIAGHLYRRLWHYVIFKIHNPSLEDEVMILNPFT